MRCQDLMFGKPSGCLAKAAEVRSIKINPDLIANYVEMKASRDLVIHYRGLINQLYLDNGGRKARGALHDELPIDADYFSRTSS